MAESLRLDRSMELYEQAQRLIPGASQTNSKRAKAYAFGAYPVFVERARGSHVWDVDGNEYIDFLLGMGPITLGYCYPAVDQAIRKQLEKGIVYGLPSPLEIEAARMVTEAVPGAERVRFLKGGGEATAAAARIARAFTGREKLLSSGYHGWPDVWTAMHNDGGVPKALEGIIRDFPFNDIPALKAALEDWKGEVAAVVICAAEQSHPHEGYLEAVRELTEAAGALLIFDEVVTGFRIALGGAAEFYGVVPDLACFAKGIANGMPLSAVTGRADVMDIAENLRITVTYGGETLSLAAAIACLHEYRERDVFAHLSRLGGMLQDGLNAAAESAGISFRATGLKPLPAMAITGSNERETALMWSLMLQEVAKGGVLLRRGGVNFICFSHSEQDIRHTTDVCSEAFKTVEKHRRANTLDQACQVKEVVPSFRSA